MFLDDDIKHRNGVCWADAPKPFLFHRCRVQTDGWIGFTQVQRCACGAMRTNRSVTPRWHDKNERSSAPVRFISKWWAALLVVVALVAGTLIDGEAGQWLLLIGSVFAMAAMCRAILVKAMDP